MATIKITTSEELTSRDKIQMVNVLMGLDTLNNDPLIIINNEAIGIMEFRIEYTSKNQFMYTDINGCENITDAINKFHEEFGLCEITKITKLQ